MKRLFPLSLFLLATAVSAQSTAPARTNLDTLFPVKPANYVTDITNTLDFNTQTVLNAKIKYLKDTSRVELAVVILPTIRDYAPIDVATEIGRRWGVGVKAEVGNVDRNNGLVLLLVPKTPASNNKGRCFLAVGNGMEGRITDAIAANICTGTIIPYLRTGDWNGGVTAGVAKITQLTLQTNETNTTSTSINLPHISLFVWLMLIPIVVIGIVGIIVWNRKENERREIEEAAERAEYARQSAEWAKRREEMDRENLARRKKADEAEARRWNALTPEQQKAELAEKERARKEAAIAAAAAAAAAALAAKRRRREEEEESSRRSSDDYSSRSSSYDSGSSGGSSFGGFGGGGGFSGGGGGGDF